MTPESLLGYGLNFREAAGTEMYMVGFLHYKVYMSASSRLLPFFQKTAKTLSFRPFIELTAHKFGDATPETHNLYRGTLPDDLGRSLRASLSPGPHLDYLNHQMGSRALVELDKLLEGSQINGQRRAIPLLAWSRYTVVEATSYAIYGEKHPFVKRETVDAFWEWQNYLVSHLMGLDITGKGYALREKVFKEYIKYCQKLPDDASHLMSEHQRVLRSAGVSDTDKAKQASIFTIASFANSAPTLYWTTMEIYSRPDLLAEVRSDLEAYAIRGSKEKGFVLDVAALKARCALIVSVINETQRTRQINSSFRKVLSDTVLDGKYLLKKGNFIQVPGDVIHSERAFWGDTAGEFNPHRFIKREGGQPSSASGFIAFGFAPYTCPARNFATTELLILVALMVVRADISLVRGKWSSYMGAPVNTSELSTVPSPKTDVEVHVQVREEWAGEWSLQTGESGEN
ncbi:hypothetical protein E0Z10_g10822 [Xylaria hypoxylon]|uniref:Cytochrome P450 n=1 Tax=Xylaria hypoxylon TaxID=37992 RepID=A0A4Z0XZ25_9PEZI|nr:hypothetical protein E0Z10_g10822 [Xylaria hypoxylon]